MPTKSEPAPATLAYEVFRQLFTASRERSRRVLVEFYESDWQQITKVKEDLDLSWKDFFHAIALWLSAFEADPETRGVISNLVRSAEEGRR